MKIDSRKKGGIRASSHPPRADDVDKAGTTHNGGGTKISRPIRTGLHTRGSVIDALRHYLFFIVIGLGAFSFGYSRLLAVYESTMMKTTISSSSNSKPMPGLLRFRSPNNDSKEPALMERDGSTSSQSSDLHDIVSLSTAFDESVKERDQLKQLLEMTQQQLAAAVAQKNNDNQTASSASSSSTSTDDVSLQQTSQQHDKEPEQREFPYRLDCPTVDLAPVLNNYKVVLAYHVGMVKNWKVIVRDQLDTLQKCGLGRVATHFIVSYSGGPLEELQDVFQPYAGLFPNDNRTVFTESFGIPWEAPALNAVHAHCSSTTTSTTTPPTRTDTVVFYFHNKGSSKWSADWREKIDHTWTYSRSLYWRKYMEYFTLERPQLCLDEIITHGAGTCGIEYGIEHSGRNFYSGNFWAASCDYVRTTLTPIDMSGPIVTTGRAGRYLEAENWIGGGRRRRNHDKLLPAVSLHEKDPSTKGLYTHLILPSEYSDHAVRWNSVRNNNTSSNNNKSLALS